jgi:hypothetical protein
MMMVMMMMIMDLWIRETGTGQQVAQRHERYDDDDDDGDDDTAVHSLLWALPRTIFYSRHNLTVASRSPKSKYFYAD